LDGSARSGVQAVCTEECASQRITLRRLVVLTECLIDDSKIAHWFRHARSKKKELMEQESSNSSIRGNVPETGDLTCEENETILAGKRSVTPNPPPGEI
jgi:hypothetical protein